MTANGGVFAILATLDTKADEAEFLLRRFREAGRTAHLIDIGVRGLAGLTADVSREEVAAAAGHSSQDVLGLSKPEALQAIATGAASIMSRWFEAGTLAGVLGIGGGQGTWIAATAMRDLPLGIPKVLVSTVIGRSPVHVRASDIIMIPSITDMTGLNRILAPVLARAVKVVIAAAEPFDYPTAKPLVGMTMFGVTTAGGTLIRDRLESSGRETAVFHANGNGGRVLESLVAAGQFEGVLDLTTTELVDELVGGIATAGPNRLESAAAAGIPQLVIPGALDVINFGAADSVPERFRDRLLYEHTPQATLMRTSPEESVELGRIVAGKLNAGRPGTVAVLVPLGGFSELGAAGGAFYDPDADRAFLDALREAAGDYLIETTDSNINDPAFAELAARLFLDVLDPASTPIRSN